MTDKVKKAVLAVLRRAGVHGFIQIESSYCNGNGLRWWKNAFNWLANQLGADKKPFTDPYNFFEYKLLELSKVADENDVNLAMIELAGKPTCKHCFETDDLWPDPAGYYCDAEDFNGAPLFCGRCDNERVPGMVR